MQKTLSLNYMGVDLIVTGDYSPAESGQWHKGEQIEPDYEAQFDITKVCVQDSKIDIYEMLTKEQLGRIEYQAIGIIDYRRSE